MELGQEMFECDLFPLGQILSPIGKEDWFWIEAKGGAAIMVEDEAEFGISDVASHSVLRSTWDEAPVAMGSPDNVIDQMDELAKLLREFAGNALREASINNYPPARQALEDANTTMLRCVDRIQRYVDEYR